MKERKINFRLIFWCFIALFLGISFCKPVFSGNIIYIVITALIMIFLLLITILRDKRIIVLVLVFMLGFGLYHINIAYVKRNEFKEESYLITGRVCNKTYDGIVLDRCKIENEVIKIKVDTKKNFDIGDVIIFNSKVENVNLYKGGHFNSFYIRENVYHIADIKDYEIIKNEKQFSEKFREKVKYKLNSVMSEENANISYAIIFGDKSSVDYEIIKSFKNSGISHLLAVSGLHIGFLATILFFLLQFLNNRYIKFFLLFIILGFYSYLCSFTPSVVRASLMCLIMFSAEMFGKNYDGLNSLGLAGLIIMLISPLKALDLGFRLSFFCVMAIFLLYRSLFNMFRKIKLPKVIAVSLAISLSSQIGILPFLINVFGKVSVLSVFTNLIVIPIFEVGYILLLSGLLLSFIMPFSSVVLKVPSAIFTLIEIIAMFISNIPFALVSLPKISLIIMIAYFASVYVCSNYVNINKLLKFKLTSIMLLSSFLVTMFV